MGTTRQVALRTHAGAYDAERWLTRFDSEIEARVMRDDAVFVLDGERHLHTELYGRSNRSAAPVGAALLPLGLLAVYGYRRRGAGPAAG